MILRAAIVTVAVIAAIAPLPSTLVERWYSRGLYPALQATITSATNDVPVALFDIAAVVLIAAAIVVMRRACRNGWRQAVRPVAAAAIITGSVLYLLFLFLWGFNYRRIPLEEKLAFDGSRVTREAAIQLANDAIGQVNRAYSVAHSRTMDVAALEQSFARVELALGATRPAVVGVPKRSTLSIYFRLAAIDGMTDPFFLEIIVNPDVLAYERPFVLAHEWAHLAGFAYESEANFVAWLTCLRGDPLAQYSGWLATYEHAVNALPREERAKLLPLEPGPRDDLRAIAARYRRSAPFVREAARDVYDSYLRANRVAEGIASYDAVLRLMLGTQFGETWTPQLRSQ